MAGGGIATVLFASGPWLVQTLYDPRYHEAGWMLQWLAVAAWFEALGKAPRAALLAHGRSDWLAFANAAKVVAIPIGIATGMVLADFPGAVAGFALSELFRFGVFALAARRIGLPSLRYDLPATTRAVVVGGAGMTVGRLLVDAGLPVWGVAGAAALTAALGWAGPAWRVARSQRKTATERPAPGAGAGSA